MRTKSIGTLFASVALVLASACGNSSDPEPDADSPPPETEPAYAAEMRPVIEKLMKDNVIPGAIVLVKSPERGDWTATFGTNEIGENDPPTPADHFRAGSNTKTMTVTVVMQLAQEGKLSLDDPISKFVPDVPNGENITLTQLAEMRSGLYSYSFDEGFNATLDREPQKAWTPEELLAIAFAQPPNFPPGEGFEYSNTNTVLLGLVIEEVTKKTAAEAFAERIFTPLDMTGTSLPAADDSSLPDPHMRGYAFGTNVETIDTQVLPEPQRSEALAGTLKPNDETNSNPSWAWTAGGATSTVDDLATYVEALVGGGLLDDEWQKRRLDSIEPTDPSNPQSAGYGLGLAQFGPNMIGHDGQLPGFMTFMGYDPENKITLIIATNLSAVPDGDGAALVLAKELLPILYP